MHVRGVEPHKKRFAVLVLASDEILGSDGELVVTGLHPLLGERAGVLDLLLADSAPTRLLPSASSCRSPKNESLPAAQLSYASSGKSFSG